MTEKDTNQNTISVGNRVVPTVIREIDIFDLHYYPENPRLNFILSKHGGKVTEEIIDQNLWNLDSTKDLFQSIKANGGLIEEIWALNNKVIEGNSRLCAYRHLYKESSDGERSKWRKIRTKIIEGPVSEKELFLVLGNLHIRGKAPWNPYEKASYIFKMIHDQGMTEKQVGEIVGMNPSSINLEIKAYETMRDKYLPKISEVRDENEELNKFSMFEEFYKQPELQRMLKESPDILTVDKYVDWVAERRVNSAAYHVKKDLAPILLHKRSRKKFLELDPDVALEEAKAELYIDHPENADDFFKKIKEMTDFLNHVEIGIIKEKVGEDNRRIALLNKFHNAAKEFRKSLNVKEGPQ